MVGVENEYSALYLSGYTKGKCTCIKANSIPNSTSEDYPKSFVLYILHCRWVELEVCC